MIQKQKEKYLAYSSEDEYCRPAEFFNVKHIESVFTVKETTTGPHSKGFRLFSPQSSSNSF